MGILLPVLYMSMSLGITFDYPSYREGNVLVYGDLHEKAEMVEKEEFLSQYKVITTPKDVRDFVRVSPRLAILTKLDHFDTIISSIIRSSVVSRETTVEIMIGSRYIRAVESVPSGQKALDAWKEKKPSEVGTHYVNNFSRGGYFLTSIVFPCESMEKKEKVMEVVLRNLHDSGTLNKTFIDTLQKIKKELGNDWVNYRFSSMNCVGCTFVFLTSLEQVIEIATGLPDRVKKAGSGYGARLIMELEELSKISNFPPYKENSKIIDKLDEVDQLFDDVMIARKELTNTDFLWSIDLDDSDEKEINEFYKKVEKCRREFLHALVNLDISTSASLNQLDSIYEAYGSTEDYQKYQKEFRVLRDKIKKKLEKS